MAGTRPVGSGLPAPQTMQQHQPRAFRWIKTDCGRATYSELAARPGPWARLRLAWFVLIAALRDWRLPAEDAGPTPGLSGRD